VYYLKESGGAAAKKEESNACSAKDFMERVKVCDILLCTVREINSKAKGNLNLRWCFEIISPNSKAYMLQACGPNDYKMWVGGIRSCIGESLTTLSEKSVLHANFLINKLPIGCLAPQIEQQLTHGKIPPDEILKNTVKTPKKFGRNAKDSRSQTEQIDFSDNGSEDYTDRPRSGGSSTGAGGLFDDQQSQTIRSPLVAKILEANPVCADCGNTDPE
jgi:hypothetical protein